METTTTGETSLDTGTSNETDTTSDAGGSGGGGSDCPTIWKGCPVMDTELEPLHERVNGAGALLLAHEAFWLQGSVTFNNPDGSRGKKFLGALRIPYEPGSTPRVLEGNVTAGMFVEDGGLVFHADASLGRHLVVYKPNGDLHKLVDVTGGNPDIFMLTGLSVESGVVALTSPNCTHVFFVETESWTVRHLDTNAQYAGGTTRTLFHGDRLYCMGTSHIFKIDPATASVESSWTDPDLANGIQDVAYSYLASTSAGLMTWIRTPPAGMARLRILDPQNLTLSDYDDPDVTIIDGQYVSAEDTLYFHNKAIYGYQVSSKVLTRSLPERRPWGGDWDFKSELQMDEDYFYWIEGWNPNGGATTLNSAEFIVRYPREK